MVLVAIDVVELDRIDVGRLGLGQPGGKLVTCSS